MARFCKMMNKYIFYILTLISLDVYSSQKEWIDYYSINLQNETALNLSSEISLLEDSNFKIPTHFTKSDYMRAFSNSLRAGKVCKRSRVKINGKRVNLLEYDQYFKMALENNDISEDCLHKLLTNYLKIKWKERSPLKSDYCRLNDCLLVKKAIQDFENNLYYISDIVYKRNNSKKLICSQVKENKDLDSIFDLLDDIEAVKDCSEIKTGQTRVVNSNLNGVTQRYSIERTEDNSYNLNFALDFGRDREFDSSLGKQIDKVGMHNKISTCLNETNPFLYGPNGEKIDIKVYDKISVKTLPEFKRPKIVSMGIAKENVRDTSKEYSANISCSTIIHELLHLTGLHDEYHESSMGIYVDKVSGKKITYRSLSDVEFDLAKYDYIPDYNHCRAISEKPSIMSSQDQVLNDIKRLYRVCKCDNSIGQSKYKNCMNNLETMPKNLKSYISKTKGAYSSLQFNFDQSLKKTLDSCRAEETSYNSGNFSHSQKLYTNVKRTKQSLHFSRNISSVQLTDNYEGDSSVTLTKIDYNCDCSGDKYDNCTSLFNKFTEIKNDEFEIGSSVCPFGTTLKRVGTLKKNVEPEIESGEIVVKSSGTRDFSINKPFLRQAHFDIIKSGNCKSRSKKYRECSRYSYVRAGRTCKNRPTYCEDEEKWLDSIN